VAPARIRATGSTLFFPAAALHAAVVLPWSVFAMAGHVPGPARLATAAGHAHEMLLGFALAVVAGHQLAPLAPRRLHLLFGLWLAARIAFIALPLGVALAFDAMFAVALGAHLTPRLFRSAKKWRNQALPAILAALCAAAVALDVAVYVQGRVPPRAIAVAIVLLLATLMLFMGGRIVAPAAAGQRYRQGGALDARVQPRLEAALVLLMATALATLPFATLEPVARTASAAAGAVALVRLARWQLWACRGRPDLACLGAGYAWIAVGLFALGATGFGGAATALHVLTVGALGTLTLNVMVATLLRRAKRDPARAHVLVVGTGLIAAGSVARVAAGSGGDPVPLWLVAAACWSGAFAFAAGSMVASLSRHARVRLPEEGETVPVQAVAKHF
jgi:uncharacterized protein involved in response to NO